jgi:hypothetical protein
MTLHTLTSSMQKVSCADLYMGLIDFANHVDDLRTPADVLEALHVVATTNIPLDVLGRGTLPGPRDHSGQKIILFFAQERSRRLVG